MSVSTIACNVNDFNRQLVLLASGTETSSFCFEELTFVDVELQPAMRLHCCQSFDPSC